MNRNKISELMGVGLASIAIAACFGGCKKDSPTRSSATPTPPVTPTHLNTTLFTLDLSDLANLALSTPSGYVYKSGIIVAKTASGNYMAVSQTCTHEEITVVYQISPAKFHCPLHGSNFNESDTVLNRAAAVSLPKYTTALSGNILSIKSS